MGLLLCPVGDEAPVARGSTRHTGGSIFPFAERPNSAGVYRYEARSKLFFAAGIMVEVKGQDAPLQESDVRESTVSLTGDP